MIPAEFKEIFQLLLERSRERQVNWCKTANESSYAVYMEEYSILLRQQEHDFEKVIYAISVLNERGSEVERFFVDEGEVADYDLLSQLFSLARRKAYNVDDAIKKIMKQLKGMSIVGKDIAQDDEDNKKSDLPF